VERLLVTGIDTVVGVNLAETLCDRFQVLGVSHRPTFESQCIRIESHDDDPTALADLVRSWQPRWIIACGTFSLAAWDETPVPSTNEIRCVKQLSTAAGELGASLTLISSDAVFAGPRIFHDESAEKCITSSRAKHVLAVEQAAVGAGTLVVRTHAYGWTSGKDASFAERAFHAIVDCVPLTAGGCRHATPILSSDLAEVLTRAFELRLTGCYHASGAERTSSHRFVSELAAICGQRWTNRDPSTGVTPGEFEETSLSSKQTRRALKMSMPLLREGLSRFVRQATDGWRDRWSFHSRRAKSHELAA
jgi:dTDP-4-dehydrorhamnose reductase